ncbi:prolipoprotein diacylglyceryl transferase [Mesonia mobilis]|uniref:Phosphatidylglycerol--prolipoprotein diacylglyceryl transferase n=1 Tax=Mesonia mobilis TaxID=369791 RepID=A0ABQ3BZC6_9FLAO|nr:prolipoprotein diacylglyceryl transferase [Mesonia mobilis]MBQ0738338.1 prolipoprotein diacylglyceryl transferase [Aquimarina celericrescens]GGZ62557.1 prolipoprotein diacylglyceryl transferase [Mesonia mobilis]
MLFSAIVWDPSKGIDLGFFMIRYYSMMYLVAFVLGWYIMKKFFKNENISEEKLDPLFIYAVLGTLIGARLGHVFFYQTELLWEDPLSVFLPFSFKNGFEFTGFQGLASHGAAIGIITAMYFYSKKHLKKNILFILDRIVIPVAIGGVFIRIGNFINSEIIGKPTNSDYGVIFKQLGETFPRHPAQLYEAGCYIIVFIILWFTYWKTDKKEKTGFIFGLFLVMLWTVRLLIEVVKEAQVVGRDAWALNTGQLLSIPFILLGLYFILRPKKTTPIEK